MRQDSQTDLRALKVDGGMTQSELLLQLQADILGITVGAYYCRKPRLQALPVLEKPANMEATARGAAYAAGLAVGVWKSASELPVVATIPFECKSTLSFQQHQLQMWKKAVRRALDW